MGVRKTSILFLVFSIMVFTVQAAPMGMDVKIADSLDESSGTLPDDMKDAIGIGPGGNFYITIADDQKDLEVGKYDVNLTSNGETATIDGGRALGYSVERYRAGLMPLDSKRFFAADWVALNISLGEQPSLSGGEHDIDLIPQGSGTIDTDLKVWVANPDGSFTDIDGDKSWQMLTVLESDVSKEESAALAAVPKKYGMSFEAPVRLVNVIKRTREDALDEGWASGANEKFSSFVTRVNGTMESVRNTEGVSEPSEYADFEGPEDSEYYVSPENGHLLEIATPNRDKVKDSSLENLEGSDDCYRDKGFRPPEFNSFFKGNISNFNSGGLSQKYASKEPYSCPDWISSVDLSKFNIPDGESQSPGSGLNSVENYCPEYVSKSRCFESTVSEVCKEVGGGRCGLLLRDYIEGGDLLELNTTDIVVGETVKINVKHTEMLEEMLGDSNWSVRVFNETVGQKKKNDNSPSEMTFSTSFVDDEGAKGYEVVLAEEEGAWDKIINALPGFSPRVFDTAEINIESEGLFQGICVKKTGSGPLTENDLVSCIEPYYGEDGIESYQDGEPQFKTVEGTSVSAKKFVKSFCQSTQFSTYVPPSPGGEENNTCTGLWDTVKESEAGTSPENVDCDLQVNGQSRLIGESGESKVVCEADPVDKEVCDEGKSGEEISVGSKTYRCMDYETGERDFAWWAVEGQHQDLSCAEQMNYTTGWKKPREDVLCEGSIDSSELSFEKHICDLEFMNRDDNSVEGITCGWPAGEGLMWQDIDRFSQAASKIGCEGVELKKLDRTEDKVLCDGTGEHTKKMVCSELVKGTSSLSYYCNGDQWEVPEVE